MAASESQDQDQEDRTEEPSPQRREQAREKGQVPRSRDLVASLTLLGGVAALGIGGEGLARAMAGLARGALSAGPRPHPLAALSAGLGAVGVALLPLFAVTTVMAISATLVQTGIPRPEWFAPDLSRLNPLPRLAQLFSPGAGGWELLKSALKVSAVGVGAWQILHPVWLALPEQGMLTPGGLLLQLFSIGERLLLRLGLLLLALAAIDYLVARWRGERALRMSRQEVREELRQSEGNPQVKKRLRRKARELLKRRLQVEVPRADVVVINPTHYAVALAYKAERMRAPRVVAKGVDHLAMRIRELARGAGVPVISNPPLARDLHKRVREGDEVPVDLYKAVAAVLAFVYRIRSVTAMGDRS